MCHEQIGLRKGFAVAGIAAGRLVSRDRVSRAKKKFQSSKLVWSWELNFVLVPAFLWYIVGNVGNSSCTFTFLHHLHGVKILWHRITSNRVCPTVIMFHIAKFKVPYNFNFVCAKVQPTVWAISSFWFGIFSGVQRYRKLWPDWRRTRTWYCRSWLLPAFPQDGGLNIASAVNICKQYANSWKGQKGSKTRLA